MHVEGQRPYLKEPDVEKVRSVLIYVGRIKVWRSGLRTQLLANGTFCLHLSFASKA